MSRQLESGISRRKLMGGMAAGGLLLGALVEHNDRGGAHAA